MNNISSVPTALRIPFGSVDEPPLQLLSPRLAASIGKNIILIFEFKLQPGFRSLLPRARNKSLTLDLATATLDQGTGKFRARKTYQVLSKKTLKMYINKILKVIISKKTKKLYI